MVSIVAIARTELLRLLRERSNLFFVFGFPLLLVILIGVSFGEGAQATRIGVVMPEGDPRADEVVARIDAAEGITAEPFDGDADDVQDRVARNQMAAGIVIPDGFGAAVDAGRPADIAFVARPDGQAASVRSVVDAAVADQAARSGAAAAVAERTGRPFTDVLGVTTLVEAGVDGVDVVTTEVGADELAQEFAGLGRFDLGASSQLFLFTFLTALTGGAALIQTRQLGVARRMAATATPMRSIVAGQAAGRVLVALTQAAYIIVATLLLFQVDWGDPVATGTVVVLFSLLSGGAGMLIGATVSNDSQAAGIGVGLGLGLAALGGSMVPLDVFPESMARIALVTPHAWANRAMAEIVRRDGGVTDIVLELGVLAAFAVAVLGLATWQLRRTLTN